MKFSRLFAIAALVAGLGSQAPAASIDLSAYGYQTGPEIRRIAVDIIMLPPDLPLEVSDAGGSFSLSSYDLSDPGQAAFAYFGMGSDELSANLASVFGHDTATFEFLFEGLTGGGSFAALDGSALLLTLTADGLDPELDFFSTSGFVQLTQLTRVSETPVVPLPTSGLLLAGAIGGFGLLRRRG